MTLKELIVEEGRSQAWVLRKLAERGVVRNKSHFSLWCNDHRAPRDLYIYRAIADILNKSEDDIKQCFTKHKK